MLPNRLKNLIERQILLPMIAVARVVTRPGPIQTQEPSEAISTQFALEEVKGVAFANCSSVNWSMAIIILVP